MEMRNLARAVARCRTVLSQVGESFDARREAKNRRRRIGTIFEPRSGICKIREPTMVQTSVLYNCAWDDQLAEKCHTVKYLRRFSIRTILERHWQDLRATTTGEANPVEQT